MWTHWDYMGRITRCSMTRASPEPMAACKIYPLCWLFWWLWQRKGMLPWGSPNGEGSWPSWKPLNSTIGRALTPIASIGHAYPHLLWYVSSSNHRKRARVDILAPRNKMGMTHQTDEKHFTNLLEYFVGVSKLACYSYKHSFTITCHLPIIILNFWYGASLGG